MRFRVLSHAGLLVEGAGRSLLFDPWLVGSAYWRSWWNYPPVDRALVDGLEPDFIYLTHIHWDHFQGPSLRRFHRETPILIPKDPNPRLRGDLAKLGFTRIRELAHGEAFDLAPGFRLTSWHFYPFTDSAAVVECEGRTLFNANDAKFMGGPLRQILRRHGPIDFVFRSHSSANPRTCFDYLDDPARPREKGDRYLRDFAAFVRATGARYAIPFASNHCFLHKEVFHLNSTITTPAQVEEYCRRQRMRRPEVRVMVSGDSWSSEQGFRVDPTDFFADRDAKLRLYASEQAEALGKFYALEAAADVSLSQVAAYFQRFLAAWPRPLRWLFRRRPLALSVTGLRHRHFVVDIVKGETREVDALDDSRHPLQIHTSAYIFRRCMALDLFLYLGISKRVLYRCRRADHKYLFLIEHLWNMFECGQLPLRNLLRPRFVAAWLPRWRELHLYARIALRKALGLGFEMADYLPPHPGHRERTGPGQGRITASTRRPDFASP